MHRKTNSTNIHFNKFLILNKKKDKYILSRHEIIITIFYSHLNINFLENITT